VAKFEHFLEGGKIKLKKFSYFSSVKQGFFFFFENCIDVEFLFFYFLKFQIHV
jgi:hypothetical protein